ncbi:MAG: pirin family protein [Burkholderiales bacterium]
MKKIVHRADSRGLADHGWLRSYHTFSFAGYHNPDRMHFGKLRVLNDDTVDPGQGFGTHAHDNMEIISIPLQGALLHKDSMGNAHEIEAGEVQVMSAGTGITHSEFNRSDTEPVNFLQIWILPRQRNINPHYEQKTFAAAERQGHFQVLISPDRQHGSLWINQEAYFSMAELSAGSKGVYSVKKSGNGVYAFLIAGNIDVEGEQLVKRDAIGFYGQSAVEFAAKENSSILCIEVPLD